MFIDARNVEKNRTIKTNVCIIGAGAAGITIAREFIGQKFDVCLLESGGEEYDEKTQALYSGLNTGHSYSLDESRLRWFGGTTNHWTGNCRPLDEIDFETREWVPYSGWPFERAHLTPFYERAQSICQLGPFTYDALDWENAKENFLVPPFAGNKILTAIYQKSPPTRFGFVYKDELKRAVNLTTYLQANVLELETNQTGRTITRASVATLDGNRWFMEAKQFILAVGGIENPRILLLSNSVLRSGLGNHHDLVGRFFMEHLGYFSGIFLPLDLNSLRMIRMKSGISRKNNVEVWGALTLHKDVLRKEQIMNFSVGLGNDYMVSPGVKSFSQIKNEVLEGNVPDQLLEHLRNIIVDIDDVASAAYRKIFKSDDPFFPKTYRLFNRTEQSPNPDSQVSLDEERDELGKRRVRLHWKLNPLDLYSVKKGQEIIAKELGRAGLGRLKVELDEQELRWPPTMRVQYHHMGTTRMHNDPKQGVVNGNCRVHGISNLFVAGSSVFPTGGYAHPTLTIVALAVRLADHIKTSMQ